MIVPVLALSALLAQAPVEAPPARPFAMRALVPLGIAGVLFLGGGVSLGVSVAQTNEAKSLDGAAQEAKNFSATSWRVGGVMLLAGGVAVSALAAFLYFFEPSSQVSVAMVPIADGAMFTIGWFKL